MSCPNINSPQWKNLVEALDEDLAYKVFALNPELDKAEMFIAAFQNEKTQFNYAITSGLKRNRSKQYKSRDTEENAKQQAISDSIIKANGEEHRPPSFQTLITKGAKLAENKKYIGLTPSDGILNKYRQKQHVDSIEFINKQADELYKNKAEDEELKHNFSKVLLTKQEYITNRTRYAEYAAYRGKVMEIVLTLPLMANNNEIETISQELDDLYSKMNQFQEFQEEFTGKKKFKTSDYFYKWALNSPTYRQKIIKILGLDVLEEDSKTKYAFQTTMASSDLGVKAILDMLIYHGDHRYSVVDFKSGYKFGGRANSIPLRFFKRLNSDITDNPQDLAKLQIMWEAVLVRLNDPKAVFQDLMAVWIPDEQSLSKTGIKYHVDPKDFLGMVEDFIKVEDSETYERIKLSDPGLFDYRTYLGESTESTKLRKKFPTSQEDKLLNELTQEIIYRQAYMDYSSDNSKKYQDEKIRDLYDLYLDHTADNAQKLMPFLRRGTDFKNIRDLSLGEYWLGSFYNIKHSLVSAALEVVHEQTVKATTAYQKDNIILKQLMTKIAQIYVKNSSPESLDKLKNILADPASNVSIAFKKIFGSYDQKLLNGWIFRDVYNENTHMEEEVMATTEEQLIENIKNNPQYSWILENGKVGKPFIDLMNFLNDRYSSVVDQKREDSLWNKVLSYKLVGKDQVKTEVTYGDEINSSEYRRGKPFVHIKGWFPKVARMKEEFKTGEKGRNFMRKYFTNFYELAFDEQSNDTEVIPLRGLGNSVSQLRDEYSHSIENQFETFMKSAYAKQYLTSAHSFIEAIKIKNLDKNTNKPLLPNLDKWLTAQQDLALKGRRATMSSPFSRALPFTFSFADKDTGQAINVLQAFNFGKTLLSLGQLTSYIRLGFNIPGGIKNTLGILFSSYTEASKQSIMQKLYNDPKYTSFVNDFTTMGAGEFGAALGPALKIQSDAMKGQLSSNKAWILMNKFNYIPSISPLRRESKYFVTGGDSLFGMDLALLPYSTSEEVLIATFFIAQMNHIKIQQGPMKGKSLWDMYEEVEIEDPNTGIKYKDFQYKKDEKGQDYVRGIVVDSAGNLEKLTELSNKELMAMHAIYEEKQGGFATLDRTFIESFVIGQVFVQFRRHLQSIIRHGMQSHGENYIKGRYQNTGKLDNNGNLLYEYNAKSVEGKWMTLAGMFLHYTPLASKVFGKETMLSKYVDNNFPKGLDEYQWAKLDQGQKENLLDFGLNVGVWALMKTLQYLAFGANPDKKDRVYLLTQKIMNETLQHWKLWQMYQDLNQSPAAFKILSSIIGGSTTLMSSWLLYGIDASQIIDIDDSDYLDRNHNFKGQLETVKTVPVLSSLRTTYLTALDMINDEQ